MTIFNNLEGEVDGYSKKDIFYILCQGDEDLGTLGSGKRRWFMDITSIKLIEDKYDRLYHNGWGPIPSYHEVKFSWGNGHLLASDTAKIYDLVTKLRDIKLNNIGIHE